MEWLSTVAKHHREYVKWVNKWGEYDFAEDLVQEMYLRVYKYSTPDKFIEEGKVNKFYVYRTLWNMYQDFLSDKKKIEKTRIGEGFECTYENTDEDKERSYNVICDKMYEAIDKLHWYDGMMFEVVSCSDSSIRQFAKDSGIGFWSVYHTVRKAGKEIKEIISEDYEDFLHQDYERIED